MSFNIISHNTKHSKKTQHIHPGKIPAMYMLCFYIRRIFEIRSYSILLLTAKSINRI